MGRIKLQWLREDEYLRTIMKKLWAIDRKWTWLNKDLLFKLRDKKEK